MLKNKEDSPAIIAASGPAPSIDSFFRQLACLATRGEETQEELFSYLHARYKTLAGPLCSRPADWHDLPGKTTALPVLCAVLRELAHRYGRDLLPEGNLLEHPELLRDYLTVRMAREKVEQFRLLFLDGKNRLIQEELQSRGTINHAPVYPREVAKRCMELGASRLIMAHNHPGGQATPSRGDVTMTQNIEKALKVINVVLLDHFIITQGAQTSFRQLGLLDQN